LRRKRPKGGRLRQVSAELAFKGFLAVSGKPYDAGAMARIVGS
jgi:hypothetical protein